MSAIAFVGPLLDPSGHADEARGFLRALEAGGHAPGARDLTWTKARAGVSAAEEAQLRRQCRRGVDGPGVAVHHYLPHRDQPVVAGRLNVARAMFETDRVPAAWVQPLLRRDEVWVPSAFNAETFAGSGIAEDRLRVVGGTLDFDLFAPGATPRPLGVEEGFVFLSNFDFSERKGWRQLLTAWARAFGPDDGVCLVLKVLSYYRSEAWVRERIEAFLARAGAGRPTAPVHLLTDVLPARELPRLYAAADAYVLPSRGEGWGRPYMEALAMGLPTIAGAWSAVTEFMDPATSWLVEGRLVDVPDDADLFNDLYRGHRWFEADTEHLAHVMREIAADPAAARARAAPARAALLERFGPAATAARLAALAADLDDRRGALARRPPRCVVRGPFGHGSSLALVNESLARGLEARGEPVLRAPVSAELIDTDAPAVTQAWPPAFAPATDGPAIAVLHWEYGDPPAEWVRAAREELDRVVVASAHVRDAHVAAGMPPGVVSVVPCGVDTTRFAPDGPRLALPREAATVFLFVGGSIPRKGIDLLLAAWRDAFTAADDVLLVIKDHGAEGSYRGQTAAGAIAALAGDPACAPVVHLTEELARDELPALFRAADVLVHPYRGEGFGLPMLEAMACGRPVVHTAVGPSREFVPADGGWAVSARRVALAGTVAGHELAGPGWVHEVEPEALVAALRAACDPAERGRRGAIAHAAAQAWTWEAAAAALARVLDELAAEALPLARHVRAARVPDARGIAVLLAPDWDDEPAWAGALDRWAAAVPAAADASLVLVVAPERAEEVTARALAALVERGHDPGAVADLLVLPAAAADLAALVAGADAVLLDEGQVARPPAALVRRARRVVAPGEETAFAAGLAPAGVAAAV